MKICLIGPTYPYRGGIAHYTTLFYRALRRNIVFLSASVLKKVVAEIDRF